MTESRIVLAVAPGTRPEVVDAAFAQAAERHEALLAVRVWHDPDLPLGGWLGADLVVPPARWRPRALVGAPVASTG